MAGDRAAVGVDVDAQGSGVRKDAIHFPLYARLELSGLAAKDLWVHLILTPATLGRHCKTISDLPPKHPRVCIC
jgi:hypothetical protein